MTKLRDLIDLTAKIGNVPRKSANVWAMGLRKVGMISKAGRGPNAADMVERDGVNMLLAAMQFGAATEIAETVKGLRDLPFAYYEVDLGIDREWRGYHPDDYQHKTTEGWRHPSFPDLNEHWTLGRFLDRLMEVGMRSNSAALENPYDRITLEQSTDSTTITVELAEADYGTQESGWHSEGKLAWRFQFGLHAKSDNPYRTTRSMVVYCEALRDLAELVQPASDDGGNLSADGDNSPRPERRTRDDETSRPTGKTGKAV